MKEIIALREANCKDCYKCIRNCPVKAISFADNRARILPEECILCGNCYVVCPQNAKEVRSEKEAVLSAIHAGRQVAVSLAPSFVAEFGLSSMEPMEEALKALGFSLVEETARGAQLVSREYERLLREDPQRVLISSCCPAVNSLIQKYHPDMLPYLAKVLTPMAAHCKALKEENPGCFTVFIGPCIAKKQEAEDSAYVDAALGFDELRAMLDEKGLKIEDVAPRGEGGARARLYPSAGGIIKSMDPVPGIHSMPVDGTENCIAAFEEIRGGKLKGVFVEMSACEGSCIAGPLTRERERNRLGGNLRLMAFAGQGDFAKPVQTKADCEYPFLGSKRVMPGTAAIEKTLRSMGKTSPDKELNCGSCGYPSCREKAIAVLQGKAVIEMCLPYLKEKAESFSGQIISNTPNAIFVLDEDLNVQLINNAALHMFRLSSPSDILHAPIVRLLDPSTYYFAIANGKGSTAQKRYLAEYKIFVEETIIYDEQYKVLICILRDVTSSENDRAQARERSKQTAEITDKVIDKQMRVVQEIASLLGETTAETKIALTKLKEALHDED